MIICRAAACLLATLPAVLLLAACSAGEDPIVATGAPEDATIQDFCGAYDEVAGEAADADAYREQARMLAGSGTPRDIPFSGRVGYLLYVEHVSTADDSAAGDLSDGDLEAAADSFDLAEADRAAFVAFVDYAAGTCFS